MVRKPTSPLEQVIRRLSEQHLETAKDPSDCHRRKLKRPHTSGPLPTDTAVTSEFMELQTKNFVVKTSLGNNCVQIGNDIVVVHNFCKINEDFCLV